jgi:hypothetical protein
VCDAKTRASESTALRRHPRASAAAAAELFMPSAGHVSLRQVLLGVSSAFFASMLLRLNCSRSIGDIANN